MPTELDLMNIHASVLFRQNGAGRMLDINEPPYDPAPRFFLGTTRAGSIRRYAASLESSAMQALEAAPADDLAAYIRILSQCGPITSFDLGPAYIFPPVHDTSPSAVRITASNKELIRSNFPYTFEDLAYKHPCFAILQDGVAVSLCCSARQTSEAAEASLATLEPARGRGYGAEVAKAWAAAVQSEGRTAMYSTAWDNFASQAVARKLHLIQYGTDVSIA